MFQLHTSCLSRGTPEDKGVFFPSYYHDPHVIFHVARYCSIIYTISFWFYHCFPTETRQITHFFLKLASEHGTRMGTQMD